MCFFQYKNLFNHQKTYNCHSKINSFSRVFSFCICILICSYKQIYTQTVLIDLNKEKQTIRGFGGANIPAWIDDLTPDQVNKAFGNGAGQIGMNILRIRVPYDTSDFHKELPTALEAQSYGAIIIASPWTPPPHMKTSNDIVGGSLKPSSYAEYAAHLKSFVDYMHKNGVSLYAISIQNEPDVPPVDYESCDWTAQEIVNFIKQYGDSIGNVKIIAAESFNFNTQATDPVLNDPEAESKVDIIGVHVYGSGHKDYPLALEKGKEIWVTEHFAGSTEPANDWEYAILVADDIHKCMVTNCSAYIWWYIRRFYGPMDDNSMLTKRGHIISQYSKFIRPGSIRIDISHNPMDNFYVTAYKKDTNIVIVAVNISYNQISQGFTIVGTNINCLNKHTTSGTKNVNYEGLVIGSNESFTVQFEPRSITTLSSSDSSVFITCTYPSFKKEITPIKNNDVFKYSVFDLRGKLLKRGRDNLKRPVQRKVIPGTYIINSELPAQNNVLKILNF